MKIIFAGTPSFSAVILESLIKLNYEVVTVLTKPDQKKGRGKIIQESAVKKIALSHNLQVIQPDKITGEEIKSKFETLNADLMLVVSYGLIIPKEILSLPKFGSVNIHASVLPKWRGAAPIERSILNGDKTTGITYMQMDEGLDTGPILRVLPCKISNTESSKTLKIKLLEMARTSLQEFLKDFFANKIVAIKQDDQGISYAKKITTEEARIDWKESAESILKKINAFNPKPGAFSFIKDIRVKIFKAKKGNVIDLVAGNLKTGNKIISVGCSTKESIEILEMQFPGKKIVNSKEILNNNTNLFKKNSFE